MPAVKSKPKPARRLATAAESAVYAKISVRTLSRWAAEGRITAIREGASPAVKYDLAEIDEVISGAR